LAGRPFAEDGNLSALTLILESSRRLASPPISSNASELSTLPGSSLPDLMKFLARAEIQNGKAPQSIRDGTADPH
jgi:hypothetical protein